MDALQMYNIIINTLLISIPEELFFVLFTYILMGEFDQWEDPDCKKLFQSGDYSRILVPTISASLVSNIVRYTGFSTSTVSFATLFALFIGIVAMGDIFNNRRALRWICEVFLFLLLAAICTAVIEFSYLPIIVYGTGKPLGEINNNMYYNFISSIPAKLMQYSLLAFLIARKRSLLKKRLKQMILDNVVLTMVFLIIPLIDVAFFVFMLKIVCYDKALMTLSIVLRLMTITGICLFPILNFFALIWCAYYIKNSETMKKKKASGKLLKIIEEINIYSQQGDYSNVKWTLKGLEIELEGIANNLYLNEKSKKVGGE